MQKCRWRIGLLFLALGSLALNGSAYAAPELPNFAKVDPGLYRGAAPTAEGLGKLKSMGVTTIIDLRIAPKTVRAEKRQVESLGMKFVNLPMGSDPPTPKQVSTFLAITKTAAAHPVFVHCQHGADRTGTMVGIYREVVDGWAFPKTYAEMRRYGFKPYYTRLRDSVRARAAR